MIAMSRPVERQDGALTAKFADAELELKLAEAVEPGHPKTSFHVKPNVSLLAQRCTPVVEMYLTAVVVFDASRRGRAEPR